MSEAIKVTQEVMDSWAGAESLAVALSLRQKLLPVEGAEGGVIFPPTYAGVGYNIDALPDGTQVATIDSVGSQANRMEPIFLDEPYSDLVPKVEINYGGARPLPLLEAGHRLGDAVVRSTELRGEAHEAFQAFLGGDAAAIAKLSPTSLVFGVWDSRDTGAKLPRVVQSVIRAWDVAPLRRDAQFNPALNYAALEVFSDEEREEMEMSKGKDPKAQRGFVHVPATDLPGGVYVRGAIERQVTVNLIALRRLKALADGTVLRRYVLGLALVAATAPMDGFLRQGCLLTPDPGAPGAWQAVASDGTRSELMLSATDTLQYAQGAAKAFVVGEPKTVTFRKDMAAADLAEAGKKGKKAKKAKA